MDLQQLKCTVVGSYNNKIMPLKKYTAAFIEFTEKLKWFNIILLTTIHWIFIAKFSEFPWLSSGKLILWNAIVGVVGAIGVTVGAHRLWTHRCYKANLPLRIILMVAYSMSGSNPIFHWVRDHRVHHKFTETDADPHNALKGFFFSHVGWLLVKKHPDVRRKGKEIDMSDILADPVVQFNTKYFIPLVLFFTFIFPTIVPPLWWGQDWYWSILIGCVARYVIELNLIWGINSAAHLWGPKPYDKFISAAENIAMKLIGFGEGCHNYHHAFPSDYQIGELGNYNINIGKYVIDAFAKIGWAYDLKKTSPDLIKKIKQKSGDGSR